MTILTLIFIAVMPGLLVAVTHHFTKENSRLSREIGFFKAIARSKADKSEIERLIKRNDEMVVCSGCGCYADKDECEVEKKVKTRKQYIFGTQPLTKDYIHYTYTCRKCQKPNKQKGKAKCK